MVTSKSGFDGRMKCIVEKAARQSVGFTRQKISTKSGETDSKIIIVEKRVISILQVRVFALLEARPYVISQGWSDINI
jgi:hypothetical protein